MIANYHTHTYRCHHATGTERGYIETAIKGGIKYMGFSDHAPFAFPDGTESNHRVYMADRFSYVEFISKLREEYKDRIDIKIGFEMEYYPLYFKDMLKIAVDSGAEYLIMGQHSIKSEYVRETFSSTPSDSEQKLETYVNEVCEGMRTGVFSYVAHPDVINFTGDREIYLRHMRRICETSNETGVPLEINFLGIRDGRYYPTQDFWQLVGEMGCDVVYGFDAHERRSAYDRESIEKAEKMREKYGLHIVEIPKIIDIQRLSTENT
ncbi:MAG: histidinol-phosphatase [Clostridia bacterium]|nr:histidinol-phosphatase [Clostridia bacterium]